MYKTYDNVFDVIDRVKKEMIRNFDVTINYTEVEKTIRCNNQIEFDLNGNLWYIKFKPDSKLDTVILSSKTGKIIHWEFRTPQFVKI